MIWKYPHYKIIYSYGFALKNLQAACTHVHTHTLAIG